MLCCDIISQNQKFSCFKCTCCREHWFRFYLILTQQNNFTAEYKLQWKIVGKRKVKRQEFECPVFRMSFYSDSRRKHNEKYHREMIAAHRSIQYKIVGALESPFSLAKEEKQATPEIFPGERASSTSSAQSVQESLTGKSDEAGSTLSDTQHQPDTDARMDDQAVASTLHYDSQVT